MGKRRIPIVLLGALLFGSLGCAGTYYEEHHTSVYRSGSRVSTVTRTTAVDVSIFYSELEPYGHWFQHGPYGWVWTPYDMPYGWRPYTDGRWVYTEYGWTWLAEESWGWAPFHYGRWLFDADYGWVWIPDTVWAPAWVAWRWSDDWIGWAPLPPGVDWQAGMGLRWGDRDMRRDLDVPRWCFVRRHWLLEPNVRTKLEPQPRNVSLFAATGIFSDYDEFGGRPRNKGIALGEIERSLSRPVPRVAVMDAESPRTGGRLIRGKEIQVYRPQIAAPADKAPSVTPRAEAQSIPGPALQASRQKQLRRIEAFFEKEQRRVESEQRKELRDATPGTDPEQLRRRHEDERRALDEEKQRELKVLEQRMEKRIVKPDRKAKQERMAESKRSGE